MARRQVIVQLDDDLLTALDREAQRAGVNRSELLRRAARTLLEATDVARAERAHSDAYARQPQDPIVTDTFLRLARENAPDW